MNKLGEVAFLYDADGVPSEGMPASSEVPSGTPAPEAGDANVAAVNPQEILSKLEKLEADRRNQQSVYDRKLTEAEKRNLELTKKLEELQMAGLDDAQKIAYERDQLRSRLEQLEAERTINDYAEAFASQFKIDKSKLDMTSEETIAESGWAAVIEKMNELEQKATQPVAPAQKPAPQNTTKVITGSGGVPRVAMTQAELMTKIAQAQGKTSISTDEFYQWGERNPEQMNQWIRDQSSE